MPVADGQSARTERPQPGNCWTCGKAAYNESPIAALEPEAIPSYEAGTHVFSDRLQLSRSEALDKCADFATPIWIGLVGGKNALMSRPLSELQARPGKMANSTLAKTAVVEVARS